MACGKPTPVRIEAALDIKGQTRQQVIDIVDAILRQNNAIECGIMAYLSVELNAGAQHEPNADLKKLGVVSLDTTTS
jgi:hypothetical protein